MASAVEEVGREKLNITNRVYEKIRKAYNQISKNESSVIDNKYLASLLKGYSPILAKKSKNDAEGLTNLIFYAAPRLPDEIFSGNSEIIVKFNDDPNFFIDEKGPKEGVAKSQSRSRWHKVETIIDNDGKSPAKKTQITFHAQSQTAVVETMIHLSVVERLRNQVSRLLKQGAATSESIGFLWEIMGLLTVNGHGVKDNARVNQWANRKISIVGSENMADWERLISSKEYFSNTALVLAEKAGRFLEKKKPPSTILFSNAYSLPNILSHYLLNKKSGKLTTREHIANKAIEAWETNRGKRKKTPLEALGESIKGLKKDKFDPDQYNFMLDNMIIFDLTKYQDIKVGDNIIDGFIKEFNDPERLKKDLQIETAVTKKESPTADPLYYINFSKIDNKIINNLNPILREAVKKLKRNHFTALYLPYAPGDLSYSIIMEMKRKFESITSVCEVGKVAHLISGVDQKEVGKIGQLIVPTQSSSNFGKRSKHGLGNKVDINRHVVPFEPIREVKRTSMMNALSVILQDSDEIIQLMKDFFDQRLPKKNISINMEVEPIRKAVDELHLDLFETDFFSDFAVSSKIIEEYASVGKKMVFHQITKSLERNGRHGVHAGTASVILALADSIKEKKW